MPPVSQQHNRKSRVGPATAMMRVSQFLWILRDSVVKQFNFHKNEQELPCIVSMHPNPSSGKDLSGCHKFSFLPVTILYSYNTVQISTLKSILIKKHGSGSESNSSEGREHQHNCVRPTATAHERRSKNAQIHKESNKYQHFCFRLIFLSHHFRDM